MDPKPESRRVRQDRVRMSLRCARCGERLREGAASCAACGHALIVPAPEVCLACGRTGLGEGEPCPECAVERPRARRRRRPWPRLAAMGGLGALLALAVSVVPGALGKSDPELAGVAVGDGPQEVERALGTPEDRASEVFWQGHDGRSHHLVQWQYGLDETRIADLTVTFIDGKVHQVGALAGGWQTSEGLRIGDRLPKAHRLYGTAIEDAPIEGLNPHRFISGGVVIRVVTDAPSDEILAIGVESPRQAPMEGSRPPTAPDWHHPPVPPAAEPSLDDAEPPMPRQRYY